MFLEIADVVVAVGHEELEVPAEREPEQVGRTHVERILVLVEERVDRRAVLHLGADILAKHVEVCKGGSEHQAVAVGLLARRRRNPAEDFLERVLEARAITRDRDFGKEVQVLQAELLGLELFLRERLPHAVQEFAFHHAGLRVLKSLETDRRDDRTVDTADRGGGRIRKCGRDKRKQGKARNFQTISHFLEI